VCLVGRKRAEAQEFCDQGLIALEARGGVDELPAVPHDRPQHQAEAGGLFGLGGLGRAGEQSGPVSPGRRIANYRVFTLGWFEPG
jgi:hypothetical protein